VTKFLHKTICLAFLVTEVFIRLYRRICLVRIDLILILYTFNLPTYLTLCSI